MLRRFGDRPVTGRRHVLRPGAYAILRLGRDVLLTHQDAPMPEFQLPGGGIDPGESPIASLHREVLEETGWTITTPRRIGAYRRFTFMPEYGFWAEKLCHIYVARPARRRGAPTEPGHEAIWADIDSAIRIVASPGDRAFLSGLRRRI